jgi:iron complex transport system ATP-binding protein
VIALGLDRSDPARVDELIDLLELAPLADRAVNRLSTGERARVLTARALASRPNVLLLDEPLSNLDPYWVLRFLDLFRAAASSGQTVLVALHDLGQLQQFGRALLISDGKVQMDEAPASLMASERFEQIFRIQAANGGWRIRR